MEFLLIASAHLLALLSPGPDFFLIMQAALRLPIRYGIAICCGIALANGIYLLLALLGLEAIRQIEWLLTLFKYLGAAYLLYIGILLLKSSSEPARGNEPVNVLYSSNLAHQFSLGFMSAILNPKNAIFYLSLFTVIVSEQTGLAVRSCYALWMVFIVLAWDCTIVVVIGRRKLAAQWGKATCWLEKVSGAMLALFGILLPFT